MLPTTNKPLRVLDFDTETRPLSYWIPDGRPTAEITAITTCWVGVPGSMAVHLLGEHDPVYMLRYFVDRYNEADLVTGHYIRKFDLPQINSALMEHGLPQLGPKLTSDTKMDMNKKGDLPATQEYLSELFDLHYPKVQMSQVKWRRANRLSQDGLRATRERVMGDVLQHMELRAEMLRRGLLKSPKVWKP